VGFSDPSQLNRVFRKLIGVTPTFIGAKTVGLLTSRLNRIEISRLTPENLFANFSREPEVLRHPRTVN